MTTVLLQSINQILVAAIVVVSVSLLLYNITRNTRNRVARTSGAVLACVTAAYVADVFISLNPGEATAHAVLRIQWIGIGLIPAALFHLSDALLSTTGLPSRGRRRRIVRLLYLIGVMFVIAAAFTDLLVSVVPRMRILQREDPFFWLYFTYFLIVTGVALFNVNRARLRCQTRDTKRRMAYLEAAMLTPVLGIFPFSLIIPAPPQQLLWGEIIANIIVILMLSFLAYPLSFFGSRIPDRVVRADLLRFMLRGPATGLLILAVIMIIDRAQQVFGVEGEEFVPFAVVAVVLFWQWMVDLALPHLERWLIYSKEDAKYLTEIQELNLHVLTRDDLVGLLEGILQAACDYLHINHAFVAGTFNAGDNETIFSKTGSGEISSELFTQSVEVFQNLFADGKLAPQRWRSYWVFGLYSRRRPDSLGNLPLIGLLGLEARTENDPTTIDHDKLLSKLISRAALTLDDLMLQAELNVALQGLLPQIAINRERAAEIEYKPGRYTLSAATMLPNREQIIDQVQAALRHYYGGPGMTQSRLLELNVVQQAMAQNDHNPVKALRAVLDQAIENQRPAGEQDYKSQEWLLYNLLEMRFINKRKVREISNRLYMSEANLYRKQNLAIEAVADAIIKLEQESLANKV